MENANKSSQNGITLFSQNNIENREPVVTTDNQVLQYNKKPKLLGVHLDENSI